MQLKHILWLVVYRKMPAHVGEMTAVTTVGGVYSGVNKINAAKVN